MRMLKGSLQQNQNTFSTSNHQDAGRNPSTKPWHTKKLICKRDIPRKIQKPTITKKPQHDKFVDETTQFYGMSNCHTMSIEETTQFIQSSSSLSKRMNQEDGQDSFPQSFVSNVSERNSNFDLKQNPQLREYLHEIYLHMLSKEVQYIPKAIMEPKNITESCRTKLVSWMFELSDRFRFKLETIYCAVNIVDRGLGLLKISLEKLPLLGVTALFMATKYQEILIPHLTNFVSVVPEMYKVTKQTVLEMQSLLLNLLQFDLGYAFPLLYIYYTDRISPLPQFVKNRAIALVKEFTLRSEWRYWPASKFAAYALRTADEDYEQLLSTSTLASNSEVQILKA